MTECELIHSERCRWIELRERAGGPGAQEDRVKPEGVQPLLQQQSVARTDGARLPRSGQQRTSGGPSGG